MDAYFSPLPIDHAQDLLEGVLVLLQQVGDDDGDAAADSRHAVHQDIAVSPGPFNKLKGILKMLPQLVILVVLCGDEEVVRNFLFGVLD